MPEREPTWRDFALCQPNDIATETFFDDYENDADTARVADDICLSCPVRRPCRDEAIREGHSGCWGGIYFVNGRPDAQRNIHKTEDIWEQVNS